VIRPIRKKKEDNSAEEERETGKKGKKSKKTATDGKSPGTTDDVSSEPSR